MIYIGSTTKNADLKNSNKLKISNNSSYDQEIVHFFFETEHFDEENLRSDTHLDLFFFEPRPERKRQLFVLNRRIFWKSQNLKSNKELLTYNCL